MSTPTQAEVQAAITTLENAAIDGKSRSGWEQLKELVNSMRVIYGNFTEQTYSFGGASNS